MAAGVRAPLRYWAAGLSGVRVREVGRGRWKLLEIERPGGERGPPRGLVGGAPRSGRGHEAPPAAPPRARRLRPRAAEGRARRCIPILGVARLRASGDWPERAGGRSAEARPWPPPAAPRAPPCCSLSATPCSCPSIRYRRPGRRALAAPAGCGATRAGVGWGLGPGLLCPAPGGAGARSWPCPFACRSDWCLSAHPAPHRRPGRGWARAEARRQPAGEG